MVGIATDPRGDANKAMACSYTELLLGALTPQLRLPLIQPSKSATPSFLATTSAFLRRSKTLVFLLHAYRLSSKTSDCIASSSITW